MMKIKRNAVLVVVAVILWWVSATSASAFEFHLLNGMALKGELTAFYQGAFHVDSEIGPVVIGADKLDYIIVEESDFSNAKYKYTPMPGGLNDERESRALNEGPLDCDTPVPVPPTPLSSMSVGPAPAGSWSIKGAAGYPGGFRGADK